MKKNIVIVILILVSLTFMVYAQIKDNDAEKAALEAQQNLIEAEAQAQRADIEVEKAMEAAAEVRRQQYEAERIKAELLECQSK